MGTEKKKMNVRRVNNGDKRRGIQVYLSDEERENLEKLSDFLRVSRSEVIRMALEKMPKVDR